MIGIHSWFATITISVAIRFLQHHFIYYLIYLKLSTVSMDFKLVLEEGDRVKWLTPGFKIGCGVVVSMSVTGDGPIFYGIQADGGRVVHLPHSCVMRD